MRISYWIADVCCSDFRDGHGVAGHLVIAVAPGEDVGDDLVVARIALVIGVVLGPGIGVVAADGQRVAGDGVAAVAAVELVVAGLGLAAVGHVQRVGPGVAVLGDRQGPAGDGVIAAAAADGDRKGPRRQPSN